MSPNPWGVARWLLENTSLTVEQVEQCCDLVGSKLATKFGEARLPSSVNPLESALLSLDDIHRCEADSTAVLEQPILLSNSKPMLRQLKLDDSRWMADQKNADLISTLSKPLPHKASVVKVFFVSQGRNAWHSTWVQHYGRGSISGRLDHSKAYCEMRRRQGTVFAIDELPGVAFQGDNFTLLVSEINGHREIDVFCRIPFKSWAFRSIAQHYAFARSDSIIALLVERNIAFCPLGDGESLTKWQSSSAGRDWGLQWTPAATTTYRPSAYDKITDRFEGSICAARDKREP